MKINWQILIALGLVIWVIASSPTTLITVVVILGALFYVSHITEHRWIRRFRRRNSSIHDTQPAAVIGSKDSEGRALRSHD
jgi:hypothetical protein